MLARLAHTESTYLWKECPVNRIYRSYELFEQSAFLHFLREKAAFTLGLFLSKINKYKLHLSALLREAPHNRSSTTFLSFWWQETPKILSLMEKFIVEENIKMKIYIQLWTWLAVHVFHRLCGGWEILLLLAGVLRPGSAAVRRFRSDPESVCGRKKPVAASAKARTAGW